MIRTGDLFFCRTYTVMGMISANIGEWEWHIGILFNSRQGDKSVPYVLDPNATSGVAGYIPLDKYLQHPLVFDAAVRHLKCGEEEYMKIQKYFQSGIDSVLGQPFELSMSALLKIGSNNPMGDVERTGMVCTEMVYQFLTKSQIVDTTNIPELSPPGVYMGKNETINTAYSPLQKLETKKHSQEIIHKLMMNDAEKSLARLVKETMDRNN